MRYMLQVFVFSFISTSANECACGSSVRVTFERHESQPHKANEDKETDRARGNENIQTFF